MLTRFFRRRTVWWPTWPVCLFALVALGVPVALWASYGESFLSPTDRQPADVLVVEGWIGVEGILAAKSEFERGGYRFIVTSGGEMRPRWNPEQWNYALEAQKVLLRAGVPRDRVLAAPARDTPSQRTFISAVAVQRVIEARVPGLKAANIFTAHAHARRSRLVFSKALPAGTPVGTIAWIPPSHGPGPWWKSSERSLDLLKESVGYVFESLLDSGRIFAPVRAPAGDQAWPAPAIHVGGSTATPPATPP
ncbi:MAG: YdcF family protein [Verrucomicrobia bacterium]|nr:YdcF family protein [Verrucomicrobiota bacterium]